MEGEALSTQFKVQISGGGSHAGRSGVKFSHCEGIQSEIEVVPVPEGGRLDTVRSVRGRRLVQTMTLAHGVSEGGGARELWDWYQEVCDSAKPLKKRTLTVTVTDNKGSQVGQWELKGAWPYRWSGPLLSDGASTHAVEQIGFSYETLKRN